MSYQVLARKWRPSSFAEMVGQEHALNTLIHALDNDRLHHAYLFTGTRGVGKTTVARIFAKCLNCEAGISSTPCNSCSTCMEINEGRFIDLLEVDAASRTKVEDTRELLDNVQYAPTAGRFKIYLIDEVHMLSNHSFNALLKTLEEPPPHVKFLLATTDPQKLPVTVLSRCLQFHLKNLLPEMIKGYLQTVLSGEQIEYQDTALSELALSADGSMRDALSLTDQAIAHGGGQITLDHVNQMLGSIDRANVAELLQAVLDQNGKQLLSLVDSIAHYAPDYLTIIDEFVSLLHRIAIAQQLGQPRESMFGDEQSVISFANDPRLSAANLQVYYQLAISGRRDIQYAPTLRSGFEMLLMRLLSFQLLATPTPLLNNPVSNNASNNVDGSSNNADGSSNNADGSTNSSDNASNSNSLNNENASNESPNNERVSDEKESNERINEAESSPSHETIETAITTSSRLEPNAIQPQQWPEVFQSLQFSHIESEVVANRLCLIQVLNNHFSFTLEQDLYKMLDDAEIAQNITTQLSDYFQQPVTLMIDMTAPINLTPALHREQQRELRKKMAIQKLKEDPNIQLLTSIGADIIEESIVFKDSEN